jgi:hypothetical protein
MSLKALAGVLKVYAEQSCHIETFCFLIKQARRRPEITRILQVREASTI